MSWDKNWEKVFRSKEWGKYPPEELVRFVARNYYSAPDRSKVKILDLGCGTGAATWYMAREGFSVVGIDGSKTAIKIAQKRFKAEKLKAELKIGDIIKLDWPNNYFDAVTDIASIQHNSSQNIKKIISEVYRVLKPGGKFFGTMIAEDKNSNWAGTTHFFKLAEIKQLFVPASPVGGPFQKLKVDYSKRTKDNRQSIIKLWCVETTK